MLTLERTKELLDDPNLSDAEILAVRDGFRALAEVMFEQWQSNNIKNKNKNYERRVQGAY